MDLRKLVITAFTAAVCTVGIGAPALATEPDDVHIALTCAQYTENKPMSRDDMMVRSRTWVDERPTYNQKGCYTNRFGNYRMDCSGFVSMTWGLRESFTTSNLHLVSHPIARADLQPGDALLKAGTHVALFIGWADAAKTRPVVREHGGGADGKQPPQEHAWPAGMINSYQPVRYDRVVEGIPVHGAIGEKYRAIGGASGPTGRPVAHEADAAWGGRFQAFERGNIYWHPNTGAHHVVGGIHGSFRDAGFEVQWGYPRHDEAEAGGGGRFQEFERGFFYWHPATGAHPVRGAIMDKFRDVGLEHGFGYPIGPEADAGSGGRYQSFERGVIYWHPDTGARAVRGAIMDKYREIGLEHTFGYPLYDEAEAANGGRHQTFQRGLILWHQNVGAHTVVGDILRKFRDLGSEGHIGYPTTDELNAANGGRYQVFEGGLMLFHENTKSQFVKGAILEKFRESGSEGHLGYPLAGEETYGADGRQQRFERATIYWTPAKGAWVVHS